jgi:hypothetical protein
VVQLFLINSIRVLPHQQDTGGFFIALLTKTKDLPWEDKKSENENATAVSGTPSTGSVLSQTLSISGFAIEMCIKNVMVTCR